MATACLHEPLEDASEQIRLLTLQYDPTGDEGSAPNDKDFDVHCTLIHYDIATAFATLEA